MKNTLIFCFFLISSLTFSQRGKTGDKTFASKFPPDVYNEVSNASLKMINEVDHDIIVLVRDQKKKYLRHVYIRNMDEFTFEDLPITRLYVQFKSKDFYYEDKDRTVINFGEKHTFNFFFDQLNYRITFKFLRKSFLSPKS